MLLAQSDEQLDVQTRPLQNKVTTLPEGLNMAEHNLIM